MSEPNSETPVTSSRRSERRKYHMSVMGYLVILFAVAFLLLLLAYFQQQRANSEATDALRQSVSAVESIENLMNDNEDLQEQVKVLQNQVLQIKEKNTQAAAKIASQEQAIQAMDWLREIQSLYEKQYYKACRAMISEFENSGLVSALPQEGLHAYDDEQVPSPAQTYADIKKALF
ncbi:MAG: hypothetical protein VB096_06645 [Pseudoflavonifractor sp.]|nr:hypothetical protein [Pseudoflavonifractor sp.]